MTGTGNAKKTMPAIHCLPTQVAKFLALKKALGQFAMDKFRPPIIFNYISIAPNETLVLYWIYILYWGPYFLAVSDSGDGTAPIKLALDHGDTSCIFLTFSLDFSDRLLA